MMMSRFAQPVQSLADPSERSDLVAQGGRLFELQLHRCRLHFFLHSLQRAKIGPIKKRARGTNVLAVGRLGGERSAWAKARSQFVAKATRRVQHGEKFRLFGKMHRLRFRAVTQLEQVVHAACGFAGHCGPFEWTENGEFLAAGLARGKCKGSGFAAEAKINVKLVARHALHVVARHPVPDQFQFANQCREFTGPGLPDNRARPADDPAGLFVAAAFTKIAEQPLAQYFGLADVNESAATIQHPVDSRRRRAELSDTLAQFASAAGGDVLKCGIIAVGTMAIRPEAVKLPAEKESIRRHFSSLGELGKCNAT